MEKQNIGIHERAGCQVPPIADWAKDQNSGGSLRIFFGVGGEKKNKHSFMAFLCLGAEKKKNQNLWGRLLGARDSKWLSGPAGDAGPPRREALVRRNESRSSQRA